jgi:hypothetical protein
MPLKYDVHILIMKNIFQIRGVMGRAKEQEVPVTNPVEAKKHRDESVGHFQNRYYERALHSLDKVPSLFTIRPKGVFSVMGICSRTWDWPACVKFRVCFI